MVYKSSFSSRGFRSGLLNPYGMEIFISILISLFFLISSYNKSDFFISFKHYVIAFSKPGLMLIAKPFEISNNILMSLSEITEIKKQKLVLEKENQELIEKVKK